MATSKIWLSFVLLLASHVLAYGLWETSPEKQHDDDQNVYKESNPTSSYDLERDRRGGSSMPSFRHFVGHGYKTPTSEETRKSTLSKDIAEVDKFGLKNRKWYWNIGFGDGSSGGGSKGGGSGYGDRRGSGNSGYSGGNGNGYNGVGGNGYNGGGGNNGYSGGNGYNGYSGGNGYNNGGGGNGYSGGNGYNGGGGGSSYGSVDPWGYGGVYPLPTYDVADLGDYVVYEYFAEPKSYKDASVMRHQNMGKLSKIDDGAFRASQTEKTGMNNGGKIHYGGVPRMEDTGEEKKN